VIFRKGVIDAVCDLVVLSLSVFVPSPLPALYALYRGWYLTEQFVVSSDEFFVWLPEAIACGIELHSE
jgi:hypothetical protein